MRVRTAADYPCQLACVKWLQELIVKGALPHFHLRPDIASLENSSWRRRFWKPKRPLIELAIISRIRMRTLFHGVSKCGRNSMFTLGEIVDHERGFGNAVLGGKLRKE